MGVGGVCYQNMEGGGIGADGQKIIATYLRTKIWVPVLMSPPRA